MKLKIILLVCSVLSVINLNCQIIYPSDSIRFVRFIDNSKKNVSIPITTLFYLKNTGFKDNLRLVSKTSLKVDSLTDLLIIEMSPSAVPHGEWDKYTSGLFQISLEIKKGTKELLLDTINSKIRLVNNYGTQGKKYPVSYITGKLKFNENATGQMTIDGQIDIKTKKPTTLHQIVFNNAIVPTSDFYGYENYENEYWKKQRENEKNFISTIMEASILENDFYDSLFNYKLYPYNNLKAKMNEVLFDFTLDRSFIVSNANISKKPSSNFMNLLGNNIHSPVPGKSFLIVLHHYYEGDKNMIDDEVNYSIIIILPNLFKDNYKINQKSKAKVIFTYLPSYGYGHMVQTNKRRENVVITGINNKIVSGTISLDFQISPENIFSINGNFQLPIIDIYDLLDFQNKMQKMYDE